MIVLDRHHALPVRLVLDARSHAAFRDGIPDEGSGGSSLDANGHLLGSCEHRAGDWIRVQELRDALQRLGDVDVHRLERLPHILLADDGDVPDEQCATGRLRLLHESAHVKLQEAHRGISSVPFCLGNLLEHLVPLKHRLRGPSCCLPAPSEADRCPTDLPVRVPEARRVQNDLAREVDEEVGDSLVHVLLPEAPAEALTHIREPHVSPSERLPWQEHVDHLEDRVLPEPFPEVVSRASFARAGQEAFDHLAEKKLVEELQRLDPPRLLRFLILVGPHDLRELGHVRRDIGRRATEARECRQVEGRPEEAARSEEWERIRHRLRLSSLGGKHLRYDLDRRVLESPGEAAGVLVVQKLLKEHEPGRVCCLLHHTRIVLGLRILLRLEDLAEAESWGCRLPECREVPLAVEGGREVGGWQAEEALGEGMERRDRGRRLWNRTARAARRITVAVGVRVWHHFNHPLSSVTPASTISWTLWMPYRSALGQRRISSIFHSKWRSFAGSSPATSTI